jgi:putative ABC transport system permease protein
MRRIMRTSSLWRVIEGTGQDFRYAARLIPRNPGFVAVAVVSLALGIGANAGVFSILNAVALRSLDAPRPEQLVSLSTVQPNGNPGFLSYPMFEAIARDQRIFSSLVAEWGGGVLNLEIDGTHRYGAVWAVTGNFHRELGAVAPAGRLLTEADVNLDRRQPAMVAVLGHGIWQREFGGDTSIIGRTLKVEGVPFTVVGIGPPGFTAFGTTTEPDVVMPITALPAVRRDATDRFRDANAMWLDVVGRLNDGVGPDEARAQLTARWPQILAATRPPESSGPELDNFMRIGLTVASAARGLDSSLRRRLTRPLSIVLAVAGLILLIACVNLASLMSSRAATRSHELAIRAALGSGRWRLARQMIVEGLLLSALAAGAALLFASWTSGALQAMITRDFNVPSILNVAPDRRVFAFTCALAVVAGVLFTIVPAWRATGQDPASPTLLQSARSVTASTRAGKVLIVSEVALSVMLLMACVLLVRTLQRLHGTDVGFRRAQVTIASRFPTVAGNERFDVDRYYPALLERIAAVPGVHDAAVAKLRPGDGSRFVQRLSVAETRRDETVTAYFGLVGPGVFRVLDMPLLFGRDIGWNDTAGTPRVAIVSRSLAERMFPGRHPVGGTLHLEADPLRGEPGGDVAVVGVVKDVRLYDPRDPNPHAIYLSILQDGIQGRHGDVLIRSRGAPVSESAVRGAIESLGREIVLKYRTLDQLHEWAVLRERVTALLAGFFGSLALALCAIGLFGLMAHGVTQRTRELAIRCVLGARPDEVVRMILREALVLVAAGIAIGVPLALISGRLVRTLLFGVTPTDPWALVLIASMLIAVSLLAAYVPGRRASRVPPMDALRS